MREQHAVDAPSRGGSSAPSTSSGGQTIRSQYTLKTSSSEPEEKRAKQEHEAKVQAKVQTLLPILQEEQRKGTAAGQQQFLEGIGQSGGPENGGSIHDSP